MFVNRFIFTWRVTAAEHTVGSDCSDEAAHQTGRYQVILLLVCSEDASTLP